jgi:hypothetical protein
MSLEEKSLRNDIESFLRGEQPPADVLALAPRLEQWAAGISTTPAGRFALKLHGVPYGHPRLSDGKQAWTGEIVWLDRLGRWARTYSRVWKLGEPEGREIPLDGVDL